MSLETDRIKKAFTQLSLDSEKEEIKTFVNNYLNSSFSERQVIKENFRTKNFSVGPTSSASCPCCGK